MSPSPTDSATAVTQSTASAPTAPSLAVGDFANLVPETEDRDTLIGVSAMKARLLYQIAQNLATMAGPSSGTAGQTVAVTVTLDQTTIAALSAALAAAVQPKFFELQTCLKATDEQVDCLRKSLAEQNDTIAKLQTSLAEQNDTIANLQTSLAEQNDTIANLQTSVAEKIDTLTCQVRELREEVLGLIEIECREPCGRMAADTALLAERVDVIDQILSRLKPTALVPSTP
jgi:uncharacterized coiled-coil protein SlyX